MVSQFIKNSDGFDAKVLSLVRVLLFELDYCFIEEFRLYYRISGFLRMHPFSAIVARVSESWKMQSRKCDPFLQIK